MIFKPVPKSCSSAETLSKKNMVAGEPEDWFTNDLLNKYQLKQISFDFFVNWSNNTISPEFWV